MSTFADFVEKLVRFGEEHETCGFDLDKAKVTHQEADDALGGSLFRTHCPSCGAVFQELCPSPPVNPFEEKLERFIEDHMDSCGVDLHKGDGREADLDDGFELEEPLDNGFFYTCQCPVCGDTFREFYDWSHIVKTVPIDET